MLSLTVPQRKKFAILQKDIAERVLVRYVERMLKKYGSCMLIGEDFCGLFSGMDLFVIAGMCGWEIKEDLILGVVVFREGVVNREGKRRIRQ